MYFLLGCSLIDFSFENSHCFVYEIFYRILELKPHQTTPTKQRIKVIFGNQILNSWIVIVCMHESFIEYLVMLMLNKFEDGLSPFSIVVYFEYKFWIGVWPFIVDVGLRFKVWKNRRNSIGFLLKLSNEYLHDNFIIDPTISIISCAKPIFK